MHPVYAVRFSSDGKTLASGGDDGQVKLWSLNGEMLHAFNPVQGKSRSRPISDVSFSPKKQMIAAADFDNNVMVWNLDLEHLLKVSCNWLKDYLELENDGKAKSHKLCKLKT